MAASTRPMSEYRQWPVVSLAVCWHLRLSGRFRRSVFSLALSSVRLTLAPPRRSVRRSSWPRLSTKERWPPPGSSSSAKGGNNWIESVMGKLLSSDTQRAGQFGGQGVDGGTGRSEERRVGEEGVRTCRSRWVPDP